MQEGCCFELDTHWCAKHSDRQPVDSVRLTLMTANEREFKRAESLRAGRLHAARSHCDSDTAEMATAR